MSKNFYDELKANQDNVSVTENGMTGYKTTRHALADFNFKVASYRTDKSAALKDFREVLKEGEKYTLKYLFYLRDAREGIGERDLFKVCIKELLQSDVNSKDEIIRVVIEQTPEYGRWDDLWIFLDTKYQELVVKAIKDTLKADFANYKAGKSISLLAKWLPSENASSKKTKALANLLIKELGTTPREYRKTLTTLRAYLDVTEVKTCGNDWEGIDYNKVPSKANLKYKNAFLAHDEERRREFLSKALVGDTTVKVHMSVGFPHDIVHKYTGGGERVRGGYDQSLEAYWKNLKPCVGLADTIVVRDGSGSMCSRVGNTEVTAMDISTALAIYCSQFLEGSFKDKFITFSSRAQLVDLSKAGSLESKLNTTYRYGDCSNTNIENVFQLILDTVTEANRGKTLEDEDWCDVPSTVLIISDMEFDPSRSSGSWYGGGFNAGANVFKVMDQKFKAAGYKLPKLAFWNVNSRTGTIPCTYNENGVLLISGFSQNVLSMVMNGKTDPYDALIEELNKERYEAIPLVSFGGVGSVNVRKSSGRKIKDKDKQDTPSFLM